MADCAYSYAEMAKMIDHSLLHPSLTDREIINGCRLARKYNVASVCVKPSGIEIARELLKGSDVAVGTVVGFPHGSNLTEVKRYETEFACKLGATEIDMVINIGKALSGDWDYVQNEIKIVTDTAHKFKAIIKIIIETDYVTDDKLKRKLCRICNEVNADFIKTSTGFGFVKGSDGKYFYRGATEEDVRLMRKTCKPSVLIKAAGGIRDLNTLIKMRQLGVSRAGATATAQILDEYIQKFGVK
ncbi:MAG: deoxyribose-phosphate aldolase [Verrucomicrobiia bacterium]